MIIMKAAVSEQSQAKVSHPMELRDVGFSRF